MRWKLALTVVLCLAGPLLAQTRPGVVPSEGFRGPLASQGTLIHFLLLEQPSVQQELRATPDQVMQSRQIAAAQMQKLEGLRNLPRMEALKKLLDVQKGADQELQALLAPEQFQRLKQIGLQQIGPLAITRPDVADAVGITGDQQKQIRGLQEKLVETLAQLIPNGQGGGPPRLGGGGLRPGILDSIAKAREAKRDTDAKILAVLTEDQKARWAQAQGAPFQGTLNLGPFGGRFLGQ